MAVNISSVSDSGGYDNNEDVTFTMPTPSGTGGTLVAASMYRLGSSTPRGVDPDTSIDWTRLDSLGWNGGLAGLSIWHAQDTDSPDMGWSYSKADVMWFTVRVDDSPASPTIVNTIDNYLLLGSESTSATADLDDPTSGAATATMLNFFYQDWAAGTDDVAVADFSRTLTNGVTTRNVGSGGWARAAHMSYEEDVDASTPDDMGTITVADGAVWGGLSHIGLYVETSAGGGGIVVPRRSMIKTLLSR